VKRTVASLLESKGSDIYSIRPDDHVYAALELMEEKRVGALVVTDGDALVGVISERDFAREMLTADGGPRDMLVSDIMTKDVFTVSPESNVGDCMAMMTDKRIRHLPVLDADGQLVGIISIGDVVSAVITSQESLIADLERYITG
jgi:CBS domain-containing protein